MGKHLLFSVLHYLCLTLALVHSQNQSGFLSLDCGCSNKSSSYIDETTGMFYTSDTKNIDSGVIRSISQEYKANSINKQFWNVRSFPDGIRNCYSFDLPRGNNSGDTVQYLIRTRFMYGNYDGLNSPPNFDIYVGGIRWDSVEFDEDASSRRIITKEIIYTHVLYNAHVCIVNTGKGTPFISVLEIRPIVGYGNVHQNLQLVERFDLGSEDGQIVRYPYDVSDRIWTPYNSIDLKKVNFTLPIKDEAPLSSDSEIPAPPKIVMRTAATPVNVNDNITVPFPPKYNGSTVMYCVFHVAEIQKLPPHQTREMQLSVGDDGLSITISTQYYPNVDTVIGTSTVHVPAIYVSRAASDNNNSTLPPLLNAVEIYAVKHISRNETDRQQGEAITAIKNFYEIRRNWQGDPCYPQRYIWEGIKCKDEGSGQYTITFLNLSSSGLTKKIANDIFMLKSLEYLDLSNNKLTGDVPRFLSQLESLTFLNIEGNELSGIVPPELIQKSRNRRLTFRYERNPHLCSLGPCKERKHSNVVIPLVASLAGALILAAVAIIFCIFKRRKSVRTGPIKLSFLHNIKKRLGSNNQQFTYAEIQAMTNNFERVLGKGAFGTVYHGYLNNNTQVAIKMLPPSTQGYKQFEAEANLLTRVHHKCLTAFLGYCYEGKNVALIYEYMANGDLAQHLSDKSEKFLSWKQRVQIAADAAEGLEYLHHGCKPPIVHRDIKSSNILLNEKLRGKIGDFGLSKIFPNESDTHMFTIIAGTPGYVDPQYCVTNRLNEKSDVFSFGVVLLELITGLPAITKTEERTHISQLVSSMLCEKREINDIVDSRLEGKFNTISARIALDIALVCVAPTATDRPTMSHVVMELKQCLAMEIGEEAQTPNTFIESDSHWSPCHDSIDISIDSFSGESSLLRE